MVIEMFNWFWLIFYRTSVIHTGAYSPPRDEIMFGQLHIDGWSLLVVYLTTSTSDIILGHIPLSFARFVWAVVWGWMISVGCLHHDFDIGSYTGTYFSIFFEYPWDWDSGQFGFRLRLVWSFRRLIILGPPCGILPKKCRVAPSPLRHVARWFHPDISHPKFFSTDIQPGCLTAAIISGRRSINTPYMDLSR